MQNWLKDVIADAFAWDFCRKRWRKSEHVTSDCSVTLFIPVIKGGY